MPEDRISLCVPYAFEAWEAPALAHGLVAKLSAHYIQHEYRECPSKDPEVVAMLEALLPQSRVLALLFPVCSKEWDLTLYLLVLMVGTVTGTYNMDPRGRGMRVERDLCEP